MISARRAKHLDSTHVYILSCKHISRPIRACRRVLSQLFINVVISCAVVFRACLHGGGGPQIGEVTCGGSPHLSRKRDQIKMRDYVDRRVTQQSELPHLPGVPHLHVSRPLDFSFFVLNILALIRSLFQRSNVDKQQVLGPRFLSVVNFF